MSNSSSVTEYTATGTVDIVAGEVATITPTSAELSITRTKLLVPDYWNDRIVQIDDISGAGWATYQDAIGFMEPVDVEIGPDGRIYYVLTGDGAVLEVIDDIGDTEAVQLFDSEFDPRALAIDHANDRLYFLGMGPAQTENADTLYSSDLDGTNVTDHFTTFSDAAGLMYGRTKGVAVSDDGIVYVLYYNTVFGQPNEYEARVLAFDPVADTAETALVVSSTSTLALHSDVVAKPDGIYVTVASDTGSPALYQLDSSLAVTDSYGSYFDGESVVPDVLYGPSRFTGHVNPGIHFIDEDSNGTVDTILQLDDITGAGRTEYGTSGPGTGEFRFFEWPN